MSVRYIRPKKFDLVIKFNLGGNEFTSYVEVAKCGHCYHWSIFERPCAVCGRYQANQLPVYFKIMRMTQVRLLGVKPVEQTGMFQKLAEIMQGKGIETMLHKSVENPECDPEPDGAS